MENSISELYVRLNDLRNHSQEMAAVVPQRVSKKLKYNLYLSPSIDDFSSEFEFSKCRLDVNDNAQYPEAAKLIEDMRLTRQAIHNLEFAAEQGGPTDTMTC